MIVRQDGASIGSIGGGLLESRVQDLARKAFGHGQTVLNKYPLAAPEAGRMGMVCGGEVQVLVQFLDSSPSADLELYRELAAVQKARKQARLITELPPDFETPAMVAQSLLKSEGAIVGNLDQQAVLALTAQTGAGQPQLISHQGKLYLVESLGREGTVYIFGAGHVSRQLAPLTKRVGFRTVVLDDRQDFANRERFPGADGVIVLNSFDTALEDLKIGTDSYLVLVSRGHEYDQAVLRQALATQAGYIGMIASRRKRDAIYAALGKEGFSQEDFDRVNSPIGLAIGAETPEEIAVSIVAELIQIRAAQNR
jgi:xanthine dehydrogenase accessory factor